VGSKSTDNLHPEEKELVWQHFGRKRDGFFIEVGANDPERGSQTWLLERNGWRGLLIEPQASFFHRLVRDRPRSKVYHAACSSPERRGNGTLHVANLPGFSTLEKHPDTHGVAYVRTEPALVTTLDEILQAEGNPAVDFLSIDVEGHELEVLRGLSLERHRPSLVLIEDAVRDLDQHRYLRSHGYRLVKRTALNNWYIPENAAFSMATLGERIGLFRKMYLATPFRRWRLARRRRAGLP
jgi:FkbM family methyltransferase